MSLSRNRKQLRGLTKMSRRYEAPAVKKQANLKEITFESKKDDGVKE